MPGKRPKEDAARKEGHVVGGFLKIINTLNKFYLCRHREIPGRSLHLKGDWGGGEMNGTKMVDNLNKIIWSKPLSGDVPRMAFPSPKLPSGPGLGFSRLLALRCGINAFSLAVPRRLPKTVFLIWNPDPKSW